MATTSPDNIFSPDLSNPWLQTVDLAAMADSVQGALNGVRAERSDFNQQFYGPAAARGTLTGVNLGDTYQDTDGARVMHRYDGQWRAWESEWISWTPVLSAGAGSFAVGNGTLSARYRYTGGQIAFIFRMLFGSTSSIGTNPGFTLPVNIEGTFSAYAVVGRGTLGVTNGSAVADGVCYRTASSVNQVTIGTWNVGSTFPAITGATISTPFGWGANCYIELAGTYNPA